MRGGEGNNQENNQKIKWVFEGVGEEERQRDPEEEEGEEDGMHKE